MEKGMSQRQAVEKAYKLHPVMKVMQDELVPLLVTEAMDGGAADVPKEELHKAMLKGWAEDGLTLSQRTTKGGKAVVESVSKTIKKTMDECQSVYQLAKNIFDGYGKGGVIPKQDIPEFLDKLSDLAVAGKYEGNTFKRAMRAAERNVNKLTTGGMKAAYRGVLAAVKAENEEKISKAITVAAEENTRYFAQRIARTEMARAYADGVFYKWMKDPDCVAFKWKLSSRHPCDDICDLYAHADLWGMGEGIFPKDSVPKLPVHPNCMCRLVPVMEGSLRLKSEEPKKMLESGGMKYIRTLTTMQRQSLLGVNGSKAVMSGKAKWMDVARGYSEDVLESRIIEVEESKKLKTSGHVKWDAVGSAEYRKLFSQMDETGEVKKTLYKKAMDMFKHRDGTMLEDLYLIDGTTGRVVATSTHAERALETNYNEEIKRAIKNGSKNLISVHNHPNNVPPTGSDVASSFRYRRGYVFCHDGTIYSYSCGKVPFSGLLFDLTVASLRNSGYNLDEATKTAFSKFKDNFGVKWRCFRL